MPAPTHRSRAFSLIELLVVITVVALVFSLAPAVGEMQRRSAKQMTNSTQLRGIQQAQVIFAQGNKSWFSGISAQGEILPGKDIPWRASDGRTHGSRLAILLDANAFTPEYMINPADGGAFEFDMDDDTKDAEQDTLDTSHFSYAGLVIDQKNNRREEWSETINTQAAVMSDRNTGPDTGNSISSEWTTYGSGDWQGTVVHNDNSTMFEPTHILEHTRYGDGQPNAEDHLFEAAGGSDADMTFFKNEQGKETQAPRDQKVW